MCQPAATSSQPDAPRSPSGDPMSDRRNGDEDGTSVDGDDDGDGKTLSLAPSDLPPPPSPRQVLERGSRLASVSLGLTFAAYSLAMPHQQSHRDRIGCDAACLGGLTSARSLLKLVGATAVGRISDLSASSSGTTSEGDADADAVAKVARRGRTTAREVCLWIGLASAAASIVASRRADSVAGLWRSLLPEALEQNLHVFRARVSEYQNLPGVTAADRAASAGALGLSVGVAMMVGPLIGSQLSYDHAVGLGLVLLLVAGGMVARLPAATPPSYPSSQRRADGTIRSDSDASSAGRLWRWLDVPSARSPPALFLLLFRLLSTTAYHIYQTILSASLRERFHFTPVDYGRFFSFVGLFFALSQGVLAKFCLQRLGATKTGRGPSSTVHQQHRQRARLLAACSLTIAVTRYYGYRSRSVGVLYAVFAVMVSAYGVMSTVVAADTAQVAAPNELGSFFGLLAAAESGAGMAGPLLGGALNSLSRSSNGGGTTDDDGSAVPASLWAVLLLNGLGTLLLGLGYERIVLKNLDRAANELSKGSKQD